MKIRVVSDLHLEFFRNYISQEQTGFLESITQGDFDLLIIAGDFHLLYSHQAFDAFKELISLTNQDILYIPGNHEYYHFSFPEAEDALNKISKGFSQRVHVLNNSTYIALDGTKFVGGTMWFREDPLHVVDLQQISDYRVIKDFTKLVYDKNAETIDFLNREVTENSIVITHHLPSTKSIDPDYIRSNLNSFYYCNMENLILDRSPAMWIHGHCHASCQYMIGDTLILANPHGYYKRKVNSKFNPQLTIEIGEGE